MICLKKYRYVILWFFVCVFIVLFIFGNSCKGGEESNAISSSLAEKILSFMHWDDRIDPNVFHKIIRKTAHFTEFGALGTALSLLMFSIQKCGGKCEIFAILFVSLATAVTDEFIQNFTGRSSMVSDILIDFSGAVTGILLTLMIAWLCRSKHKPI